MATKNKETRKLSAAEVDAAISALIIAEDQRDGDGQRCTAIYCLGVSYWSPTTVLPLHPSRKRISGYCSPTTDGHSSWHYFEEAKQLNRQSRPVAYRQHIGDGYYVSVNGGVMCVDVRKFYLPYGCLLYTSPSPRD